MKKLDALRVLLAKVEAGESLTSDDVFNAFEVNNQVSAYALQVDLAYGGSLDAAFTLFEAVHLAGWRYELHGFSDGGVSALVTNDNRRFFGQGDIPPARALLIAILEALIAQEEETP